MRRPILILLALVAVALGAAVALGTRHTIAPASTAAIGGPFHLIDQRGRPVSDADLKGKPSLVFFGFTYCPEVCPTTLTRMSGWLRALGSDADKINIVFVSIDPERDTPTQLAIYLTAFDPRIVGLTGGVAAVNKVADEYRVYHRKVPLAGGGYTMDHSAVIYTLDKAGAVTGVIAYDQPDAKALETIRASIAS